MIFVETPIFTAQIKGLLSDDDYGMFQRYLADNPEAGNVIKETGGLRKIRVAAKGHGKSGGASDLLPLRFRLTHRFAFRLSEERAGKPDTSAKRGTQESH
jgi:hypothetical protein